MITSVQPAEDGGILVRGCNLAAEDAEVCVEAASKVSEAEAVSLFGKRTDAEIRIDGKSVVVQADGKALFAVKMKL